MQKQISKFSGPDQFYLIFLLFAKYFVTDCRYIGVSARMRDALAFCRTKNTPRFISNVARNIYDVISRNITRASGSFLSSTHTEGLKEFV